MIAILLALILIAVVGAAIFYVAPIAFRGAREKRLLKQQFRALEQAGKYSVDRPGLSEQFENQAAMIGRMIDANKK